MSTLTALRFNMTNIADAAAHQGDRYQAALDMAGFADAHGVTALSCEEHHLAETSWLPAPLVLAAALAGRTSRIRISVNALLITLYDPVRLAEDIAVLDNLSKGRFCFVAGMGYRPEEYAAVGMDWEQRGQLMDRCIEVMLAAWGSDPFEYQGAMINVTPKPHTRPHPLFFVGGMSTAAARRAARFGLPFSPPMEVPEAEAVYAAELTRHGRSGFVYRPESARTVLLSPDPDDAWRRYGDFFMNEAAEYAAWRRAGVPRPNETPAGSVAELRALNVVEILTPDQLVAQIAAGRKEVVMNPLVGGLPLEAGWASLRMLGELLDNGRL